MKAPDNRERPAGNRAVSDLQDTHSVRQTCAECGREPVAPGFKFFGQHCLDEYATAALDRRRAAELRMPPVMGVVA